MSAVVFVASLLVAFVAGMVALAMPCCFTVLLPSYIAKSFTTVRSRLQMTAVFGSGMATVLLPIAMGATFLTSFIALNHSVLFVIGGFAMVVLGLLTFWGMSLLPQVRVPVDLSRKDLPSVYGLGVFGGVASSCCAPVLVGVVFLTVLAGGWFSALAVGIAYVTGMVFPLLVAAIAWDRRASGVRRAFGGRLLSLRALGLDYEIHSSKLVAGLMFVGMGAFTIVLGVLDRMLLNPMSDLFGIYQTALERWLVTALANPLTSAVAGAALVGGLLALLVRRRHRLRTRSPSAEERPVDLVSSPEQDQEETPGAVPAPKPSSSTELA